MAITLTLAAEAAIRLSAGPGLALRQGSPFWAGRVVRSSTSGATGPPQTWEEAEPTPGISAAVHGHQAVCGLHQLGAPGLDRSPQDRYRARVYRRDQLLHARYGVALIARRGAEAGELLDAETAERIGRVESLGCICCWEGGHGAARVWVPSGLV